MKRLVHTSQDTYPKSCGYCRHLHLRLVDTCTITHLFIFFIIMYMYMQAFKVLMSGEGCKICMTPGQ